MEILYQTERINFVLPSIDYVQEYTNLMNNPELYIYITENHHDYSIEDEINWVNRNQDGYTFTLLDRVTGDFIGNCSFNEINGDIAEIGIVLVPEYHNNHYGREAIMQLINIGFNVHGFNEIMLVAFDYNQRGINCYQACGFEIYNTQELDYIYNGQTVNDVYMRVRRMQ